MSVRQDFKDTYRFIQRVAKNSYKSYNDAQVHTRDATSNSSSRTTQEMLQAVARYADTEYDSVASVLWMRLTDYKHRRHVLKALIVIEFLLMRSGEQFMADVVERIDVIRRLKMFKYFKNGEEVGYDVREQASRVMSILENFDDLVMQRQHLQETGVRLAVPETGYIFGEEAQKQPLQLEYHHHHEASGQREEKFDPWFHSEAQAPAYDADAALMVIENDAEADVDVPVEQEEEKPKKNKRGRKMRRKKLAKKVTDEEDEAEQQDNEELVIVPVAEESNASLFDDFLADLAKPKSNKAEERALVPASSIWEPQSESTGQLGWLQSSMTAPVIINEMALFDSFEPKPAAAAAAAGLPRQKSVNPEASLFDLPAVAHPPQPNFYNPYAANAGHHDYFGYPVAPQGHHLANPWGNQLMLPAPALPAPAANMNAGNKQHQDVFNWMN